MADSCRWSGNCRAIRPAGAPTQQMHFRCTASLPALETRVPLASCSSNLRSIPLAIRPSPCNRLLPLAGRPSLCRSAGGSSSSSLSSSSAADLPPEPPVQPIEDPYKVLGVLPLDPFDRVKQAHARRRREAEARSDEATVRLVDQAYDSIMMRQLTMRKQGVTFGSVKVSEDIKYADSASLLPWLPRFEPCDRRSVRVNAAVAALGALWAAAAGSTGWKVLQLLTAFFVFRLFLKLAPFYPPSQEDGEKRWQQNGRRLLRSLGLVFGCVAVASLGYSAAVQVYSFLSVYVPRWLFTAQELIITLACCGALFQIASYYR